jgi:transcription initiation factor TFIIE subunit alpha
MSMDKDEATRRQERDAEAEAKRQQNALPEWIRKSTVSGHLTASGVAESARAGNAAGSSSSNDEILRGLGTVGPARVEEIKLSIVEDVKPVMDKDQIGAWPSSSTIHREIERSALVDYDRYYASLAASTNGTPSGLGIPGGDDFGASDDEEDRKPSIEYLNSLNDYRKRSRSREDIGTPKSKIARLTDIAGFDSGKVNGHVVVPVVVEPQTPDGAGDGLPLDDPVVYGKSYFPSYPTCCI